MIESARPIRTQTTRRTGRRVAQRQGTLLLYPDRLVYVHSPVIGWSTRVGLVLLAVPGFILPPHTGPGALGALIGAGGGSLIGGAIAKSQANRKVAAGSGEVTVIELDSIASIESRQSNGIFGRLGGRSLAVTTADGAVHWWRVNPDKWSADLAGALAVRGREVRTTPEGMVVTAHAGAQDSAPAAYGVAPEPLFAPAWEPASEGLEQSAALGAWPGGAVSPTPPPPSSGRKGLIIGIVAAVLALAGVAGAALYVSSASSLSLPGTLLGVPRYTGSGAHAEETHLTEQMGQITGSQADSVAGVYGDPASVGRGFLVAEGRLCDTCTLGSAGQLVDGLLASSAINARSFPPGPDGGVLACFSYSAQGQTGYGCIWASSKARTAGFVVYVGGAASGLPDAAARTRQIRGSIEQ